MERLTQDGAAHGPSGSEAGSQRDAWGAGRLEERLAANEAQTDDDRLRWLARTIEADIIPRLMLAHCAVRERPAMPATPPPIGASPSAAQVEEFARLALADDAAASAAFVAGLRADGATLDTIYMELLAPAARRLGVLWEADLCDFAQVTLGLWRIQQVMYDLSPAFHQADAEATRGRKALLAPAPDSQHTFGLLMVSEFFRRAGWDVWARTSTTADEMVGAARAEWFDVCGISLGSECHVQAVASVILEVRATSLNPGILVMVGGPIVLANPELVGEVGADATAFDAERAVAEAEKLVSARERFC